MKNKIITLKEMSYTGYKISVDLNAIQNACFGSLWAKVFAETKALSTESHAYYIGYQDYAKMRKKKPIFDYYALAPSSAFTESKPQHHSIKIKAGDYILFKNTLDKHGPTFFKRVYRYVAQNNIKVTRDFDFEFLPMDDFKQGDKSSTIYVGLKLLE